jgi:signal transduction histidine kinase
MVEPEKKMFGFKDTWVFPEVKEKQRLEALSELGLGGSETIPIFEEATQIAARFLATPISILGFVDGEHHWFKSSVGLSRLGLMNKLAQNRKLSRGESFCNQVVETAQVFVINNTDKLDNSCLKTSQLVQEYGIRSYLGAPLIDAMGNCLGALAVMDLVPRTFTNPDIEILQIIARWCMSEFERNQLLLSQHSPSTHSPLTAKKSTNYQLRSSISSPPPHVERESASTQQLKLLLLGKINQELCTPLTSVLGMANVLGREIYGPLSIKQREYVDIIQNSGQYLLSLINEIAELGVLDENCSVLNLAPVDIEMLCQQTMSTLKETAHRREQNIRLSIEPGYNRIWLLDKEKVRQILYHLIFSVIQVSATGSTVRIHISYQEKTVNITVSVFHVWLGDGISEADSYFHLNPLSRLELTDKPSIHSSYPDTDDELGIPVVVEKKWSHPDSHSDSLTMNAAEDLATSYGNLTREQLGLLLSVHLAEFHGGKITIQGSPESGQRYVLSLPIQMATSSEVIHD